MKTLLVAALLAVGLVAPAKSADILMACSSDVEEYCSNVEPGHGRLLSCLYAHEQLLSASCDAAMGDAGDVMDTFFFGLRMTLADCADDIQKLCDSVAPGEGRIFSCLASSKSALSQGCAARISAVPLPAE